MAKQPREMSTCTEKSQSGRKTWKNLANVAYNSINLLCNAVCVGLTLKLRKSLLLPELSIHESTKRLIQHICTWRWHCFGTNWRVCVGWILVSQSQITSPHRVCAPKDASPLPMWETALVVALPIKSLSCFNEDKKAHRVLLPYTQPLTSAKA